MLPTDPRIQLAHTLVRLNVNSSKFKCCCKLLEKGSILAVRSSCPLNGETAPRAGGRGGRERGGPSPSGLFFLQHN